MTESKAGRGRPLLPMLLLLGVILLALGRGVAAVVASTSGATYYVSPSGSDQNSGTSPSNAWQTVAKVNSVTLQPGDTVLFAGGASFTGRLTLSAAEQGSAAAPITISSYGTGRATLSNSTDGIFAYNTAGIVVQNINLVGG